MIPNVPMEEFFYASTSLYGVVKLLLESRLQFDVVEPVQEWERYNLIVIPDELQPDNKTVERLHKYIASGGAVIICHHGGLAKDSKLSWLEQYGFSFMGDSSFKPAYMVIEDGFVENMPGYEYALYNGASQWKVKSPAKTLGQLGEPLFQRSAEHFTSHQHAPFDHVTEYSTLAVSGRIGLIGFPIGGSYYDKGYWVYRAVFQRLLGEVLPLRLIETNAPLNAELTLTYQPASKETGRSERYMVHIINWSPSRKTPPPPEVHEDPVALTNVRVKLNIPLRNVTVKTAVSGNKLQYHSSDNGIDVTIPRILVHEIVCFEMKRLPLQI
jgi:hypothetical protein